MWTNDYALAKARESRKRYAARIRKERKRDHLCIDCGQPLQGEELGHQACKKCAAIRAEIMRKLRERRKGMCPVETAGA